MHYQRVLVLPTSSSTTSTLVMTDRYPFLSTLAAAGADSRGGAGGNIEVLPDGRLLLGDSAIPSMQAWVRARGGFVLPAEWLQVGHVDEWLTVRGDGTVVYVDAVLGLELILRSGESAWTEMQRSITRAAVKHPELASYLTLVVTFEDMEAAIRSYLRDPAQAPPYRLADFDFATRPMALPRNIETRVSRNGRGPLVTPTDEERLSIARWIVHSSLEADASIAPGLETLRTAGIRLVPTPELHYRSSTLFPSAFNALWLDDVVITADPFYAPFRTAFSRAVGRRVEFLDGVKPWQLQGGIHCATQVSRRPPCPLTAPRDTLTFDHAELRCSSEDPCSAAMTCAECNGVGFEACGWCPGTGCVSASEMDRCESGWADRITECVDCNARTTCGECTGRNAFCGWCDSSCVPHSAMSEESCGGDYRTFADGCG